MSALPAVSLPTVAALFVQDGGCYSGQREIDAWPESRDARSYAGPFPVVAHPPCQRWGKMWFGQPLAVKLTGVRKKKGDDGGCFAAALAAVHFSFRDHPTGFGGPPDLCPTCAANLVSEVRARLSELKT